MTPGGRGRSLRAVCCLVFFACLFLFPLSSPSADVYVRLENAPTEPAWVGRQVVLIVVIGMRGQPRTSPRFDLPDIEAIPGVLAMARVVNN